MQACSLDSFMAWLNGGTTSLNENHFLLTFDDGFLGVYEHAAPVLSELGWPATVFLVSGLIGGRDEWCRQQNPSGATYPLLAGEHIVALRRQGIRFHSHTRRHPDLTRLSDDALTEELVESRQMLTHLLGEPVDYLAYPYGRHDERVREAARAAGYRAAFSTQPGFNRQDVDRFRIRRLDIFGTDTPAMLLRKVRLGSNDGSLAHAAGYYLDRLRVRLAGSGS